MHRYSKQDSSLFSSRTDITGTAFQPPLMPFPRQPKADLLYFSASPMRCQHKCLRTIHARYNHLQFRSIDVYRRNDDTFLPFYTLKLRLYYRDRHVSLYKFTHALRSRLCAAGGGSTGAALLRTAGVLLFELLQLCFESFDLGVGPASTARKVSLGQISRAYERPTIQAVLCS